jgi:hypothetical protein
MKRARSGDKPKRRRATFVDVIAAVTGVLSVAIALASLWLQLRAG